MRKHMNELLGLICYGLGVIAAAYYGLWKMLLLPIHTLAISFRTGGMTFPLVASCGVKLNRHLKEQGTRSAVDIEQRRPRV